ncbi:hypothetical protein ALC60_07775, partial [Trachymyrmex zeteki]
REYFFWRGLRGEACNLGLHLSRRNAENTSRTTTRRNDNNDGSVKRNALSDAVLSGNEDAIIKASEMRRLVRMAFHLANAMTPSERVDPGMLNERADLAAVPDRNPEFKSNRVGVDESPQETRKLLLKLTVKSFNAAAMLP